MRADLSRGLRSSRQPQRYPQSAEGRRIEFDTAAIEFGQLARNRQTETETRRAFIEPFARTQHLRDFFRSQSRPIVLDNELRNVRASAK